MSITDELREWAKEFWEFSYGKFGDKSNLIAIADRIDSEHERAMSRAGQLLADAEKDRDYNYANWQDCKQKVLQGNITFNELEAEIERLKDELSHCIELPKDADGEYIRIGDVMEGEKIGGGYGEPFEVVGYVMSNGEFEPMDEHRNPRKRKYLRHHHEPTVEDVLRELVAAYMDTPPDDSNDGEFFAKYAAKLRLAEGEDA